MKRVERIRANLAAMGLTDVAKRVAAEYHVSLNSILDGARMKSVAAARHRIWVLLRHTLDMSNAEIANTFGVDRSTVDVAIRKREAELARVYGVAS